MNDPGEAQFPPFPNSRATAENRLRTFLPGAARYAAHRNRVAPGHDGVSRLSPALRHRLILEEEVVAEVLSRHRFQAAEKFLQEVHWRTYWKGWLEFRPQVWRDYVRKIATWTTTAPGPLLERVEAVCRGTSGVAILDRFTRELIETGYLHNHARMWWAGYWIHVERLPWELGADFFHRHLLDADPASNTLGWRWVAGLQTPGKTYLPRRSNLERYCDPGWLADDTGLERLEDDVVEPARVEDTASVEIHSLPKYSTSPASPPGRFGFWLHEDDATLEIGAFRDWQPCAIAVGSTMTSGPFSSLGRQRRIHLSRVLCDGGDRAARHFRCPVDVLASGALAESLGNWALEHQLQEVVGYAPFVGPGSDAVSEVRETLSARGIRWTPVQRQWDAELFPFARAGFFPYWARICKRLGTGEDQERQLPGF